MLYMINKHHRPIDEHLGISIELHHNIKRRERDLIIYYIDNFSTKMNIKKKIF